MKNIYTRIATSKTRGGAQLDTIPYVPKQEVNPIQDEYVLPSTQNEYTSASSSTQNGYTTASTSSPPQNVYDTSVSQDSIPYSTTPNQSHTAFYIVFGIGNLIALGLITIGIILMIKNTATVQAVITAVDCSKSPCVVAFKFTAENGKNVTGYTSLKGSYKEKDTLTIQYNKENPNTFTVSKMNTKTFGGIWLGIGGFILLILWIIFFIKRRN